MTLQAHHAPDVLLLGRGEGAPSFGLSHGVNGLVDQPAVLLYEGEAAMNPRKRTREAVPPMAAGITWALECNATDLLFFQRETPPPTFVNLAQLQSNSAAALFSAGIQITNEAGLRQEQYHHPSLFEELAPGLTQYLDDVDGYICTQGEVFQRKMVRKWRTHCRNLLRATNVVARQKIRSKEEELERAVRKGAEVEERLHRLMAESAAWQARAVAAQTQLDALRAQLSWAAEEAAVAREGEDETGGRAVANDAASDEGIELEKAAIRGSCRGCRRREAAAAVLILPCRHLCVCVDCAATGVTQLCPACGRVTTGSIHVAFG